MKSGRGEYDENRDIEREKEKKERASHVKAKLLVDKNRLLHLPSIRLGLELVKLFLWERWIPSLKRTNV